MLSTTISLGTRFNQSYRLNLTKSTTTVTTFQVNFSHIIKFETFERDQSYIIRKSGIENLVTTHRENVARDGKKSADVVMASLKILLRANPVKLS